MSTEKSNQVTVTVSGLTGSGKSAIMSEIIIALRAVGVEVHPDKEWTYEMRVRTGDSFDDDIERIKPVVLIREVNIPYPSLKDQGHD